MKGLEALAVIVLISGVMGLAMGMWMVWDWTNSLFPYIDQAKFQQGWVFPWPFFLGWVHPDKWTLPFDMGLTFVLPVAALCVGLGCYLIGYTRE